MKITREINGKTHTFELTEDELYNAYFEQEHIFDVDDISSFFDELDDGDIMSEYGKTREEVKWHYDEIAYEMRRQMDKYDVDMWYARGEAIRQVFPER